MNWPIRLRLGCLADVALFEGDGHVPEIVNHVPYDKTVSLVVLLASTSLSHPFATSESMRKGSAGETTMKPLPIDIDAVLAPKVYEKRT